jgi:AcrR family transcriptional regulator
MFKSMTQSCVMHKSEQPGGGTISRMPPEKSSTRRVSRQREAGEVTRRETRRKLLVAASQEFADSGYRAATVSRIADRADVSVQTLYHSWGSKRDLLRGVLELAVTGEEEASLDEGAVRAQLLATIDPEDAKDPQLLLAHLVHGYRVLAERSASVWRTYRDAAAVDADIAADWRALMELRRSEFHRLMKNLPKSALRKGLTQGTAADTAWALASPQLHEALVDTAGYTYDELEAWLRDTLVTALLEPSTA